MDYKGAVEQQPGGPSEVNEIVHTSCHATLMNHVRSMIMKRSRSKVQNAICTREETIINNIISDNETEVCALISNIKEWYFFDGLCSNLNAADVFDVFKKSASVEYTDEEGSAVMSDEEPIFFDQAV